MALLWDSLIVLLFQACFFLISWSILPPLFLPHYKPPSLIAWDSKHWPLQVVYSASVSSSCILFVLVVFEIAGILDEKASWNHWHWNLQLVLALVTVIIPFGFIYTFVQGKGLGNRTSVYLSLIGTGLYLYLFSHVANQAQQSSEGYSLIEFAVYRVCIIGVTIMSALSGFGVIYTPYSSLSYFAKNVTETEVEYAKKAYEQTLDYIQSKKLQLQNEQDISASSTQSANQSHIINRIFGRSSQSSSAKDRIRLEEDIEMLKQLARSMLVDVEDLEYESQRTKASKTLRGKCMNFLGTLFSVYCVYKLVTVTLNVILNRLGRGDPVSTFLSLLLWNQGEDSQIDLQYWSQQLSYLFIGIIVVGSVRGFLTLMLKLSRRYSQRAELSPSSALAVVAYILSTYLVSSVVMMQVTLPQEYRQLISKSLGHIEFDYFLQWSDIIFLICSIASSIVLYVMHSTSSSKSLASDFADLQLGKIEQGM
ncbi:Golgi pH regulator A [Umbelopsis nana]